MMPLPEKSRDLISTCSDMWKELFTNSSKKIQFLDEIGKGLISNTPEFHSLNGSFDSINADYNADKDSVCPPQASGHGTFRSQDNNDIHRFVLEFNHTSFRYMIDGKLPKYVASPSNEKIISQMLPPLKQVLYGTHPADVACNDGLNRVFTHLGNPACVKPESVSKLTERGWIDKSKRPVSLSHIEISYDMEHAQKITDSANQFALDFYKYESSRDENKNIFFSSPSMSTAFSILYEGAREDTADEMQDVFGFPKDDDSRRIGFYSYLDALNKKSEDENTVQIANALWLANGFEPLPEYVNTARTYYSSSVDSVDFVTDQGVNRINDWTKTKTQDKIQELLKPSSTDSNTRMVITNAIYFLGSWEHPFDAKDTYEADFAVDAENTVKVQMMTYPHKMRIGHASTENMQMLQMPYKGESLSMLIILPNKIEDMESVEKSLTTENLKTWKDTMRKFGTVVHIPKFKMETEYDLTKSLPDMGMPSVFGPADLSGITGHKGLYVSEAIHKAFVDVNEKGTEAAAATAIVTDESSGQRFIADHPFIFMIQDNETGSILFMGKVVDPSK